VFDWTLNFFVKRHASANLNVIWQILSPIYKLISFPHRTVLTKTAFESGTFFDARIILSNLDVFGDRIIKFLWVLWLLKHCKVIKFAIQSLIWRDNWKSMNWAACLIYYVLFFRWRYDLRQFKIDLFDILLLIFGLALFHFYKQTVEFFHFLDTR